MISGILISDTAIAICSGYSSEQYKLNEIHVLHQVSVDVIC